jgi:hypothetical protein
MDTFKIETIQENKTNLQSTCFQELQCMYNILIKPKVDDGTYFEQGGYKAYRDDFARLRENIKQRRPGADSYIVSYFTILWLSKLLIDNRSVYCIMVIPIPVNDLKRQILTSRI